MRLQRGTGGKMPNSKSDKLCGAGRKNTAERAGGRGKTKGKKQGGRPSSPTMERPRIGFNPHAAVFAKILTLLYPDRVLHPGLARERTARAGRGWLSPNSFPCLPRAGGFPSEAFFSKNPLR